MKGLGWDEPSTSPLFQLPGKSFGGREVVEPPGHLVRGVEGRKRDSLERFSGKFIDNRFDTFRKIHVVSRRAHDHQVHLFDVGNR